MSAKLAARSCRASCCSPTGICARGLHRQRGSTDAAPVPRRCPGQRWGRSSLAGPASGPGERAGALQPAQADACVAQLGAGCRGQVAATLVACSGIHCSQRSTLGHDRGAGGGQPRCMRPGRPFRRLLPWLPKSQALVTLAVALTVRHSPYKVPGVMPRGRTGTRNGVDRTDSRMDHTAAGDATRPAYRECGRR